MVMDWSSRLFLLAAAICPAALQPLCEEGGQRPELHHIQPRVLPWKGGPITITGASFEPDVVISISGEGGGGSQARQCSIISYERTKITCSAPPSELSVGHLTAHNGGCESVQELSFDYVGWRWQDKWRWRAPDNIRAEAGEQRMPAPRMGHTLSVDGQGNLILYGGLADAGVLGDVWMLRTIPGQEDPEGEQWTWTSIEPAGHVPPPRTEHVAGVVGGRLYVFGGWNAMTNSTAAGAADSNLGADGSAVSS